MKNRAHLVSWRPHPLLPAQVPLDYFVLLPSQLLVVFLIRFAFLMPLFLGFASATRSDYFRSHTQVMNAYCNQDRNQLGSLCFSQRLTAAFAALATAGFCAIAG